MKTFGKFEEVSGMRGCMKRPIVVHAKQIDEEFRVDTLEGVSKEGKPGDYLMTGVAGEHYPIDQHIWDITYDWV
jgi:hypothetical protein